MTTIEHRLSSDETLTIPRAGTVDFTDADAVGRALLALTFELVTDPLGTMLVMSSIGNAAVISGCRHIDNDAIARHLHGMQAEVGELAVLAAMWVSRDDDDHHHVHGDPMASRYRMLFVVGTDPRNIHAFTIQRKP